LAKPALRAYTLVKMLVILGTKLIITNIKMVVSPGFTFYRTNCIVPRTLGFANPT
jgi:hypothetical protein